MKPALYTLLSELNREFYIRFADDFARTRRGWPPGFARILPHLRPAANVLDLGCGNGRLLAFLAEAGWRGRYTGVDSSPKLLAIAAENAPRRSGIESTFVLADLGALDDALPASDPSQHGAGQFDAIACLATLHHIPGRAQRAALLNACAARLRGGGTLIVSTWQFATAARLQERILPWSAVELTEDDLEPGDTLLAWGQGAAGRRYCAAIGEDELHRLAGLAGLTPIETILADGHEGNLNLYGVYAKRTEAGWSTVGVAQAEPHSLKSGIKICRGTALSKIP